MWGFGAKKEADFVYKGGNKDQREALYICTRSATGVRLPRGMSQLSLSGGKKMRVVKINAGNKGKGLKAIPTGSCLHGGWFCPSIKGKLMCPESELK